MGSLAWRCRPRERRTKGDTRGWHGKEVMRFYTKHVGAWMSNIAKKVCFVRGYRVSGRKSRNGGPGYRKPEFCNAKCNDINGLGGIVRVLG